MPRHGIGHLGDVGRILGIGVSSEGIALAILRRGRGARAGGLDGRGAWSAATGTAGEQRRQPKDQQGTSHGASSNRVSTTSRQPASRPRAPAIASASSVTAMA